MGEHQEKWELDCDIKERWTHNRSTKRNYLQHLQELVLALGVGHVNPLCPPKWRGQQDPPSQSSTYSCFSEALSVPLPPPHTLLKITAGVPQHLHRGVFLQSKTLQIKEKDWLKGMRISNSWTIKTTSKKSAGNLMKNKIEQRWKTLFFRKIILMSH